jgi:hypothetical protein
MSVPCRDGHPPPRAATSRSFRSRNVEQRTRARSCWLLRAGGGVVEKWAAAVVLLCLDHVLIQRIDEPADGLPGSQRVIKCGSQAEDVAFTLIAVYPITCDVGIAGCR